MARSRVNRDIHFSPFEMVYGYKPDIQDLSKGLQLVEPDDVPRGKNISPELKLISNKASDKGISVLVNRPSFVLNSLESTTKSGLSNQIRES